MSAVITEDLENAIIGAIRDAKIVLAPLGHFKLKVYQTARGRDKMAAGTGDEWSGSLVTPWTLSTFPGTPEDLRSLRLLGGETSRNPLWTSLHGKNAEEVARDGVAKLGLFLPYTGLVELLRLRGEIKFEDRP